MAGISFDLALQPQLWWSHVRFPVADTRCPARAGGGRRRITTIACLSITTVSVAQQPLRSDTWLAGPASET